MRGRRRQLTLRRRILITCLVVLVVIASGVLAVVRGTGALGDRESLIRDVDIPLESAAGTAFSAVANEQTGLRGYMLAQNTVFLEPVRQGQDGYSGAVATLDRLSAGIAEVRGPVTGLEGAVEGWRSGYERPVLAALAAGDQPPAALTPEEGKRLFDVIRARTDDLAGALAVRTAADFDDLDHVRAVITALALGLSVAGALIAVTTLVGTVGAMVRPLRALRAVAGDLIEGRPVDPRPPEGPAELTEVHALLVASGALLQERQRQLGLSNDELERASQLKSEFLATMSHELRTPLNSIIGFTELLRGGSAGSLSPKALDYLERVARNGRTLLELINDVLDLSRIEAGRMVVSMEVVDLVALVRQVCSDAMSLAAAKGLQLKVDLPPRGVPVLADRRALLQVLTNLVGNAVKFTPAGWVEVVLQQRDGRVLVDVADSGPGVRPEEHQTIFEPFRQAAGQRAEASGSGLGLPISRRLIALMRGDIRLRSTPGEGAVFTVDLEAISASDELLTARGAKPLVLAVDHDLDGVAAWRGEAEQLGFVVAAVTSADAAILAATHLTPAVAVLDTQVGGADGWAALDRLRHDSHAATMPLIVASAAEPPSDGASSGEVTWLHKPFDAARLADALRVHLPAVGTTVP